MKRRTMMAGLACGALPLALPGRATQTAQGCFTDAGQVHCTTGFTRTPPMPVQPCRAHAWATCLAYLLRGYGARLETGDVLARAGFGSACPATVDGQAERQWVEASAGEWRDTRQRRFLVSVTALAPIAEPWRRDPEFLELLARLRRQPVLCGAAGHATVITEIVTVQSLGGWLKRTRVTVQDPFAPSHGLRALTDAEAATPSYVLGIAIRTL